MPVRRALLFGEELPLRGARRVAVCAGADVAIEPDPARLEAVAGDIAPDLVLFDLDHAGPATLKLLDAVRAAAPAARLVATAHPSPPPDVAELLGGDWFAHLLGKQSPWFMDELAVILAHAAGRSTFGLDRHLPWAAHIEQLEVTGSAGKAEVFDAIEALMGGMGVRGRLVQRLQAVADEMLMNAVYDAPVDRATGETLYASLPRTTPVDLPPDQRPTFSFGSDGRRFGMAIRDPFGALEPATLRRYIAKGLRRGDDQIDRKAGGAGLGLYLMFQSVNSMTLSLTPGRCTEMVGLVDIRGSYRDVLHSPKSFNVFVQGESG